MKSFPIVKIAGIGIELHSTFILLVIIITGFLAIFSRETLFQTLTLFFLLFLSVALHELTHSLVASARGFKVRKIILLPIGGVALMDDFPKKPKDEFLISIAGPLFNFFLVFVIILTAQVFALPFPWELFQENLGVGTFTELFDFAIMNYPLFAFMWVNLILGSFNLFVPALPLDGGRVLRSILGLFFGFNKSTKIVAGVSFYLGAMLLVLGFLGGNLILAVIAIFIILGSKQENEVVLMHESLGNVQIKDVYDDSALIMSSELSLEDAFNEMQERNETAFLVHLEGSIGIITADKISGFKKSVRLKMKLKNAAELVPNVSLNANASDVLSKMLAKNYPLLPVVENYKIIGSVSLDKLQKAYELSKIE
ncbi:MAG: site-2 protease family protein [Candidatus Diapherotrites archaeon]